MYKNNQLRSRYFPRSQRISYWYRETPRCPNIYIIDLNQFLLLFMLTINKHKYFSSSPKIFFLLHCLWIYPALCGSTSVLQELYCYDLLHLEVNKHSTSPLLWLSKATRASKKLFTSPFPTGTQIRIFHPLCSLFS